MVQSAFTNLGATLQSFGVVDILLPFLLVFTIVFAVLQRTHVLGHRKNFNVVIALVLGLLFITPHLAGTYPLGYDPVQVLNEVLPSISLVAIASVMLLILLGIFGRTFSRNMAPIIAIFAIGFVVYIFGSALHFWDAPSDAFSWWTPETTELIVILLIFGVIVYLITKEPGDWVDRSRRMGQGLTSFLEDAGRDREH